VSQGAPPPSPLRRAAYAVHVHVHGTCTAPAQHLHGICTACTLQVHPIVVSKAPRTKKAEPNPPGGQEHGLLPAPGDNLKGAVDVRGIVLSAPTGQAKPKPQQEEISLGPDFSDEEHVPPLCNT